MGALPGEWSINATSSNASGEVAGYCSTSTGFHALVYNNGEMTDLGSGEAYGINVNGQVVGTANGEGVLFSNGGVTELTPVGEAYAINDSGVAVGWGVNLSNNVEVEDALLWSKGVSTYLFPAGSSASNATGINDKGQVVGEVGGSAYLYSGGTVTLLNVNRFSDSTGINASGQVIGSSAWSVSVHGFLCNSDGSEVDLGTLGGAYSNAFGVNDSGEVVGVSEYNGTNSTHAFLYTNGSIFDLNNLIPANSGWTLESATAINDSGEIVGDGYNANDNTLSAFLLTPDSPEPGSLGTIVGLGLMLMLRTRRTQRLSGQ